MDFAGVVDFLGRNSKFIVTAHETPDGDAIGSEIAMYRALVKLDKTPFIFNADPTPRKFRFLDTENTIRVLEREDQLPEDLPDFALLMLDTNDIHNIGQLFSLVLPRVKEHYIIDHHENEDDILSGNFIQKGASSTAEILYQLLLNMNIEIDFETAQALYTAIVYDTGSFVYPKTTALTFEIARDLVSRGVEPNRVYASIYESNSISALLLQSKVLSTLELHFDNRVSVLTMRRDMIFDSGAIYEEADQLINLPLKSEDVRVSIFFKQNTEGLVRCSLRSKGNINVAEIAQRFGGGGHKTAAGFKCFGGVESTKERLFEMLRGYFT
jgi:phosphoesterase RecJ-like protein